MQWTAPTTGIAMCQIASAFEEPRESAYGYEPKFQSARCDGELGAESGPSGRNVDFLADLQD